MRPHGTNTTKKAVCSLGWLTVFSETDYAIHVGQFAVLSLLYNHAIIVIISRKRIGFTLACGHNVRNKRGGVETTMTG